MRLTRKKAIELCIELWAWLAKTGKRKWAWPEWEKYEEIENDCWFCEYDKKMRIRYQRNKFGKRPDDDFSNGGIVRFECSLIF